MIVDDDKILNLYCWRCSEFIAAVIQSSEGAILSCQCGADYKLPKLESEGQGHESR